MVVGAGKSTDASEALAMEEVAAGEEDVVTIRIASTTYGMVLKSKIFLGISAVPIGMHLKGTVKHLLDINADVGRLVAEAVTAMHAGDVAVAEA